jgi:hypothetical protein
MERVLPVEMHDKRHLSVPAGFPNMHARRAELSQHYVYPAPI